MKEQDKKDLSSFWDLEDLIPARKPPHRVSRTSAATEAVDIFAEPNGAESPKSSAEEALPEKPAERPSRQYEPELVYESERGLIKSVEIYPFRSTYPVYEQFRRDALKLNRIKGQPCRKEPFFSFVPQYSQLTRAQLNTYLWWREEVRNGRCPEIDFSYLKLYLFELINLSDRPEEADFLGSICRVWLLYRDVFSQLDRMIAEWVTDYCLIHRTRPPAEMTGLLPAIERIASLREFFIEGGDSDELSYVLALVSFCTNYDYRKSRYAAGETLTLLDRHIPAALSEVLRSGCSATLRRGPVLITAEREAFAHALCATELKKRILVRYYALNQSYELRYLVTEMIKYCENHVRAALGIKSRLTARQVPDEVRKVLDTYFDSALPKPQRRKAAPESAEETYWKLYDTEQKPLSLSDAIKIEDSSWETTKKLVESFSEIPDPTDAFPVSAQSDISGKPDVTDGGTSRTGDAPGDCPVLCTCSDILQGTKQTGLSEKAGLAEASFVPSGASAQVPPGQAVPFRSLEIRYLAALLAGDARGARDIARAGNEPEEALVDRINEASVGYCGDILLEQNGDGDFCIIEEYQEIAEELISNDRTSDK